LGFLWLALIIHCSSGTILFFQFYIPHKMFQPYPLRCVRVPQVDDHCCTHLPPRHWRVQRAVASSVFVTFFASGLSRHLTPTPQQSYRVTIFLWLEGPRLGALQTPPLRQLPYPGVTTRTWYPLDSTYSYPPSGSHTAPLTPK
jgi:hypothetical protein